LPLVLRDLITVFQVTIVDSKDLAKLEADKAAEVKQSEAIIDGIVTNLEARAKKKAGGTSD
jgi:hypothetical protein